LAAAGGRSTFRAVDELPLSALLARALGDLTDHVTRAPTASNRGPSVPLWFGVLRAVPPEGVAQRDLPARARLSTRAIRQATRSAEGAGWISVGPEPSRSGPQVRLTAAGRRSGELWRSTIDATERRWATGLGPAGVGRLRGALESIVGLFDLELPHYPISYGSADSRVTGGHHHPGSPGSTLIPPHGQDWSPVVRSEGDFVSGLALVTLLGQALVGFTIDYEAHGPSSLLIAEGLTRGFADRDAAPLKSLPHVLGVSGSGRSGLERHGLVAVTAAGGKGLERLARLTPDGQRARDTYGRLVREVEAAWRRRYGATPVTALRSALEDIDSRLPPGLPHHVMVTTLR
jgi:hypothetical protein